MPHDDQPTVSPSWEQWREVGFFRGFFVTIQQFYYDSCDTFERMPSDGPIGRPLAFLFTAKLFNQALWVLLFWFYLLALPQQTVFPKMKEWVLPSPWTAVVIFTVGVTCAEIVVAFLFGVAAAIVFRIRAESPTNFSVTLRVLCYSMGLASFLTPIPLAGLFLGCLRLPWYLLLGPQETHQAERFRYMLVFPAMAYLYWRYLFAQQWMILKFLWDFFGMRYS